MRRQLIDIKHGKVLFCVCADPAKDVNSKKKYGKNIEEYFVVRVGEQNGKYKEAIRIVAHDSDKRVHRTKNVLRRVASLRARNMRSESKQPRADFWWPPIVSLHRAANSSSRSESPTKLHIFYRWTRIRITTTMTTQWLKNMQKTIIILFTVLHRNTERNNSISENGSNRRRQFHCRFLSANFFARSLQSNNYFIIFANNNKQLVSAIARVSVLRIILSALGVASYDTCGWNRRRRHNKTHS